MEQKILQYESEFGKEKIMLQVRPYGSGSRLYIGMAKPGEEEASYGDLTVNLPYEAIAVNEAFISDASCKHKLQFIRKYKLGKVLQRVGRSGYCAYRLVQFDLKKLAEYDPEGVEKFLAEHEKTGGHA